MSDLMDEMGKAMMGTGEASGEDRALQAAEKAIANPLLDEISLKGATGVLINVTGSNDMTLFEVDEAANRIRDEVDPEANIIVGSTFDSELTGSIRVSVVATGIDVSEFSKPSSQVLNEFEKSDRNENKKNNEQGHYTENISNENEINNNEVVFDRNTLDSEKKELEPLKSNVNSATLSTLENLQHSDDSTNEIKIDPQLTQTGSEIDLPPRNQISEPPSTAGGLNNLIRRMTGFGEKRDQKDSLETKSQFEEGKEETLTDREDESKLEIPAFLRRQAN